MLAPGHAHVRRIHPFRYVCPLSDFPIPISADGP